MAAELPASRPGHRAFVRANKLPRGGFAVVRFEMSNDAIGELEDRWETNEDFLDKQSETVSELSDIDDVMQGWGLDPDVLVPAWQVDFP